MKKVVLLILVIILISSFAQNGALTIQGGTSLFYSDFMLKYENFDMLANANKNKLKPYVSAGMWRANLFSKNNGATLSSGLLYLHGSEKNFLQIELGAQLFMDRGTAPNNISFIAVLPDLFVGYRFENSGNPFLFNVGLGFPSVVNFGIGLKM